MQLIVTASSSIAHIEDLSRSGYGNPRTLCNAPGFPAPLAALCGLTAAAIRNLPRCSACSEIAALST